MTLAEWLNDELNRRQWSQSDLARASGLKRQTVNYIVSGQSKSPDSETMKKLARALNLPVEELYRAGGLLPAVSYKEALIKRIESKAAQLTDPRDIERVEKFIDMLAGDDTKRPKTKRRTQGAASSS